MIVIFLVSMILNDVPQKKPPKKGRRLDSHKISAVVDKKGQSTPYMRNRIICNWLPFEAL